MPNILQGMVKIAGRAIMIITKLKNEKEFQRLCQGKCVYFSKNECTIQYFVPAKINDVETIYVLTTTHPIPLREHYDFEDTEGVYVPLLIEIDSIYALDINNMTCTKISPKEPAEAY